MPPRAVRTRAAAASVALLALLPLLGGLAGCAHERVVSHTPRTATEQLLVAESAEQAVAGLVLPGVEGLRVALEVTAVSLAGQSDLPYLQAALEDRLRQAGAEIVEEEDEPDRVLAVRVAALATTGQQSSVRIPSVPLLVAQTPEITFFTSARQYGFTKLRVTQREVDGDPVASPETAFARTRFRLYKFFFVTIQLDEDVYPDRMGP